MQKRINLIISGILLICSGIFFGFQEPTREEAIQKLINEEIERKVERYRISRMRKCKEKIFEEGGRLADSIVIARAKALNVLQDTMNRPAAPGRPDRPQLLQPIDSSAASPLLEKGIPEDPGGEQQN